MFLKKFFPPKVGGDIARYDLVEWWIDEFTENERQVIRAVYGNQIDKGPTGTVEKSVNAQLHFLWGLAGWFTKCEHYEIGKKILARGEMCINENSRILDLHFFFYHGFKVHYPSRDKDDKALLLAIDYCKRSIALAPHTKKAFQTDPVHKHSLCLPRHPGYEHLAIIYEKQGRYEDALVLTRQAQAEGWNNDCEKRIARLLKKLEKTKNI